MSEDTLSQSTLQEHASQDSSTTPREAHILSQQAKRQEARVLAQQAKAEEMEKAFDEAFNTHGYVPPVCEVENGWVAIVIKLVADLHESGFRGRFYQTKQKFAGLRIYTDHLSPGGVALLRNAEEECARTCEACGQPGKSTRIGNYWMCVLCEACRCRRNGIRFHHFRGEGGRALTLCVIAHPYKAGTLEPHTCGVATTGFVSTYSDVPTFNRKAMRRIAENRAREQRGRFAFAADSSRIRAAIVKARETGGHSAILDLRASV